MPHSLGCQDDMPAHIEHVPNANTCGLHYTENQCSFTEGEGLNPCNFIDEPTGAYAFQVGGQ